MYQISIVSQKGGPGKSIVARLAAVAYSSAGWDTYIMDSDTEQTTSARWMARREIHPKASTVNLHVIPREGVNPIKRAMQLNPDLLIVDGRPAAFKETADFASQSHLVLIPVGTGLDDLNPAATLARQLISAHGVDSKRIRFVLNHVGPRGRGVTVAMELLEESTGVQCLPNYLSERPSYRTALDDGKAPQECSHHIVKAEAMRVVSDIFTAMEEVTAL
ncbi:MAG: ParA family protein [Aeromonadaceae bacterium]